MRSVAASLLPPVVKGQRARWFVLLLGNGVLQAMLAVAAAWTTRELFDQILPARIGLASEGLGLVGGLVLAVVLIAALRWREAIDAERLAQHYVAEVRVRLFNRLAAMSPRVAGQRSRGGVMLRFVGDVQALRAWVGLGLARLVVACMSGGLLLGALAWMDPRLMAAVVAVVLTMGALMARYGIDLRQRIAESRRRNANVAANMHDKIASVQVMQVFNQVAQERLKVKRQNRSLTRAMVARASARGRHRALTECCIGFTGVLVIAYALWPRATPAPTVGTVLGVISLIGLLATPLRDLGRVFEHWHAARVAQARIGEFLASPILRHQRQVTPSESSACSLGFSGVGVGGLLVDVDAVLQPGRRVALVGEVGCGKSTLLALAAGLMDPDCGEVSIDGHPLRSLALDAMRSRVSMVGPDLGLTRGTIESNLRYRHPGADEARIARACELSGLDRVLQTLPAGLATPVRDAGRNLSDGQRRAVVLARSLMNDPAILLIDDSESCFDGEPQRRLGELFARIDASVLYVARTPAVAELADEIWQIEQGRLQTRPGASVARAARPAASLQLVSVTARAEARPESLST